MGTVPKKGTGFLHETELLGVCQAVLVPEEELGITFESGAYVILVGAIFYVVKVQSSKLLFVTLFFSLLRISKFLDKV